jgi:hypothetical protein
VRPHDIVVEAALAQFGRHGSAGQAALAMLRAGECLGQSRVVDQPDVGEPVENPSSRVVGDIALAQRLFQLGPAAGALVE